MSAQSLSHGPDVRYRVAFSHVPGIGPARLAKLEASFGSLEAAWSAPERRLTAVLGPMTGQALASARRGMDLDATLERLQALGVAVVTPAMTAYPDLLRQVDAAPFVLYVRGSVEALHKPAVAVVGTRKPTQYGRDIGTELAGKIARGGLAVVSGLAMGVDAAAHRSALKAGGTTVAVLGCGIDVVYPLPNRELRAEIERKGAVVSELPLGTRPEPGNFPARNRIVSGLARSVVVVEAGVGSGALITARCAAEQGRDVICIPGRIDRPESAGCLQLIAQGAMVAVSVADVLEKVGLRPPAAGEGRRPIPADATEAALLAELGVEPRHVDDLCRAVHLAAREVTRALSMMEIKGMARHVGQMHWTTGR
jgi:DNA processing protein